MNELRAVWMFITAVALALASGALTGCSTEILAPTASVTAASTEGVAVGATVALDGTASADPQELTLYYDWSFVELPPGSASSLVASDTPKPYFVADVEGTYVISLVVSNGTKTSEPATTSITAGPCGTFVPVVESITASPAAPNMGQPVGLSAVVTDADIDAPCSLPRTLTHGWSLSKVPPGSKSTLDFATVAEPFFVPDVEGTYAVTLVATDDLGRASAPFNLEITVGNCGSNAPAVDMLTAAPQGPVTGQTVQLGAAVSDPDSAAPCNVTSPITYAWSIVAAPLGSEATLNLPNAENPSFTADRPGDYTIELVVKDGDGIASAPATLVITASTCGDAPPTALIEQIEPVLVPPGNAVVAPDVGVNDVVQLGGGASSDADTAAPCGLAQTLSYAWSFVALPAGSTATINNPEVVNPSFFTDVPGTYVVGLVVTDSTGLASAMATFTITADPSIGIGKPDGFTITTVAAGALFTGSRGVTEDGAGNVYVANANARVLKVAPDGTVTILTQGGFLQGAHDIAFEPGGQNLYVTTQLGVISSITLAGVQSQCVNNVNASFRGVDVYTGSGGLRLIAADQIGNRLAFYDPIACTLQTTNNFNGSLGNPWGVDAALVAGTDTVWLTDQSSEEVRRNTGGAYVNDGGTSTLLSNSNLLGEPRDIVATPCATPKLIVANRDGANLLLFTNAPATPPVVIVTGMQSPVGLHFESDTSLLVTDETLDAVFRLSGPFCSL